MKKQHSYIQHKLIIRKKLLDDRPGDVFVPYCGEGDLSKIFYENRNVLAVDINSKLLDIYKNRLPNHKTIKRDVNKITEEDLKGYKFCILDFDAYLDPYPAIERFFKIAHIKYPVIIFVTDGTCIATAWRSKLYPLFEGEKTQDVSKLKGRQIYKIWDKIIFKIFWAKVIPGIKILNLVQYKTSNRMWYYGMEVDREEC